MEAAVNGKPKKRLGFGKILGIILLLILIALVAAVAIAYIYLSNSVVEMDDIAACVAEEPMGVKRRLSVDAANSTVTFLIDKNDVYWVMDDRGLLLNQPDITNELERYDIRLDGWSVSFGENTLRLNVRLVWKEAICLPLHLEAELLDDGGDLGARINALYIGDKVRITPEQAGKYIPAILDYTSVSVTENGMAEDFCDRLKYLKDISITEDGVHITCSLGMELFDLQREYIEDTRMTSCFVTEATTASLAVELDDTGSIAAWNDMLKAFEDKPAALVDFRRAQLSELHLSGSDNYFSKSQMKYINRFFAGLDAQLIRESHKAMDKLRDERMENVKYMETSLFHAMNAGLIKIKNGDVLYEKAPLTLSGYFADEWAERTQDMDGDNMAAVDAADRTDLDSSVGLAFISPNGTPMLAYYKTTEKGQASGSEYFLEMISEDEYTAYTKAE